MISVIIPAFNASDYLNQTVKSVLSQSYRDWELIIINDGSRDNTLDIARNLVKTDERIKVYDKSNGGVSSARNLGIQKALGDYLAFLDADDIWEPYFLQACLEALEVNKNLGLVHSDLAIINEKGQKTGQIKRGKSGQLLESILAWEKHTVSPPSGILVRKNVLSEIGGFDEKISNNADQDFYIRCARKFTFGRVAEPLLQYREHQNNMHSNISVLERDSLYVFRKAAASGLFCSEAFKRKCFANMYLILSINYIKEQRNWSRFVKYLAKAILVDPMVVKRIYKRLTQ